MPSKLAAGLTLAGLVAAGSTSADAKAFEAQSADAISFGGPSSTVGQLDADQEPKASLLDVDRAMRPFRQTTERLKRDYGITLGLDYNALYQYASESLDKQHAAGGVLRFYGTATVFDQASGHPGGSNSRSRTVIGSGPMSPRPRSPERSAMPV